MLLLAAASAQLYDHVTITADTMVPLFAPMTERLANQFHLTDTVVAVEDIYATWPGRDRPEKIRNFIIDAYVNWLTTYVLIGGDVEVVPHNGGVLGPQLGQALFQPPVGGYQICQPV